MRRGIRLRSLRTRIVAWSFVPAAIILIAVALVTFYAYQQVAEDLVVERNGELARLSAGQLASELDEYTAILSEWAQTLDVAAVSSEALESELQEASNRFVVFDRGVFVLDWKGKLRAAEPPRPDLAGQDWSEYAFFREALHTRRPVFSGVLQAAPALVYASGSILEESPLVVVAVPVLGGPAELHVIAGGFRLGAESLSSFYGSIVKLHIGGQDTAYLVDGDGLVIYHPDAALIGQSFGSEAAVQRVMAGSGGAFRTRDRAGREIVASFAPVPGTPWGLIIESDWRALLRASGGYRSLLLGLLALGVVLPSIVVAVGVRRITRPIADLTAAAQQVAAGNLGQTVTASTGDEIEELVEHFNRMSVQLAQSYAALQAREERLALVLRATNDGIWDWDLDSGEVYYSPRWKSMLGYEEQEIGTSWEEWRHLVHPSDLPRALTQVEQERAGVGPGYELEHRLRHKDGSYHWILARGLTLRDASGRAYRMIGSHTDISRRKEFEAELRRQNEYLAALHETTLGIVGRLSVTELLEALVERAVKLADADDGFLYLVRSEPSRLELAVAAGWSSKDVGLCLGCGEGLAGKVWEVGHAMAVEDYDSWPGRSPHFAEQGIGPDMAVPLYSGKETVGVLGVSRASGDAPFAPDHMDLIERLAQLASIALDNARLHTSLQEELAERVRTERALERRLAFEKIVADVSTEFINLAEPQIDPGICRALAVAGEFTAADRCYVFVFSPDGTVMTNTHEWCRPGIESVQATYQGQSVALLPWSTQRVKQLETVHVPSLAALPEEAGLDRAACLAHDPPTLSFLNVPMIYHGSAIGLLGLDGVRAELSWDQDSIALLRLMGEVFANALEHKWAQEALQSAYQTLEQRVRERTHELATLNAIAALASRSLDLKGILRDTLDQILATLGMEAGIAFRLERGREDEHLNLTPLVWRGLTRDFVRAVGLMDARGTAFEAAASSGYPQVWDMDHPGLGVDITYWLRREGIAQFISVPLMAQGTWVGAIYLGSSQPQTFAPEQLSLLAAVGQQVGMAVENARLFQAELAGHAEAERRRRVAEGMRGIMNVLNSSRSLREILDFIVEQASRLLGADAGLIAQFDVEGRTLTFGASHAWPAELAERGVRTLASTKGNQALLSRQPHAIGDLPAYLDREGWRLETDDEFSPDVEWQRRVARHFGAILAAPIVVKDSVYGALAVYYRERRELVDEDYRLSMILADQIALALENAQLREQAGQAAASAERSRLARELHDSVTQNLYSLTLYAEAAARQMAAGQNQVAAEYLRDLSETAQEALREMRLLIFELRPPALEKGGLLGALQARLDAVEKRGGLGVELRVEGLDEAADERWLPLAVQQELYHLAQEALNNSLKHAKAHKVQVSLQVDAQMVQLTIADDGVGFDAATAGEQGGLGLAGMRERVQRIGGQLEIVSGAGGTRITVRVART